VNSKEKPKKNIIDKDISELKDITILEVKGNQQEKSTENSQPELKLKRAVIPDAGLKNGSTNSKKTVLVRHFEMFSNDAAKTEAKLQLLEGLLRDKYERIIIFSSRSFECLLNTQPKNGKGEMIDFRERWTNVMNKFYTVYYQWKKPGTSSLEKTNVIKNESLTADKIISDLNQYCNSQINDKIKEHVKTEGSNDGTQANSVKRRILRKKHVNIRKIKWIFYLRSLKMNSAIVNFCGACVNPCCAISSIKKVLVSILILKMGKDRI
jgi:hypothetical protein